MDKKEKSAISKLTEEELKGANAVYSVAREQGYRHAQYDEMERNKPSTTRWIGNFFLFLSYLAIVFGVAFLGYDLGKHNADCAIESRKSAEENKDT